MKTDRNFRIVVYLAVIVTFMVIVGMLVKILPTASLWIASVSWNL